MRISSARSAGKGRLKTIDDQASQRADSDYLSLALALARRGLGNVWPNPSVGCVIVRDGLIVGRGWTQPGGRPHGETQALGQAKDRSRGATAFVTLEPCVHHGQTPPCAQALINAGIARVVIAAPDLDHRVDCRGAELLHAAGVLVEWDEQLDAIDLNVGFLSRIQRDRPMVTMKLASTLDGAIATANGESQWITGSPARRRGHLLRAQHDAILVGIGTVLVDDPELTCRLPGMAGQSPVRVVLDSRLRLPPNSRLVKGAEAYPLWILTGSKQTKYDTGQAGVDVISTPLNDAGRIDLDSAMAVLARRGITRLLIEGGCTIAPAFLSAGLVDRVAWFRASGIMGGDGLPVFGDLGLTVLDKMPRFRRTEIETLGDDVLESYVHQA